MPRIGLLSDSHSAARTTERAVAVLMENGAQLLIHLGDVGSIEVLDALAVAADENSPQIEAHVVFGNTDYDWQKMADYARSLDLIVDHPAGQLTLPDGGVLAFMHGDRQKPMDISLGQNVKYLCHGHTHVAADQMIGQTRVINPGALYRARQYTVAILDTDKNELMFYPVS